MDLFKTYFDFVGRTEAPAIYHRWTLLSILGTLLGRQVFYPFGHGKIYPNQYIMLMGSPGTRKGTAMNIGRKLLQGAGYSRFCPDRLSKERFLMEIKPYNAEDLLPDSDLEALVVDAPSEIYAFAEEFTDLVGQGGMEFMTMLTKLWDNMPSYEHPKIHGRSIVIERPTVNIYGGNTQQGLALAIPPESLGNGFLSRMIFIHADPTGKKITRPDPISQDLKDGLVGYMRQIRETMKGEISETPEATELLDRIYQECVEIEDLRFKHYMTRRYTHCLKLCMVVAAAELTTELTAEIVLKANTFLVAAERTMPKALGEYGRGKYQEVSSAILEILSKTTRPLSINELFKKVGRDLIYGKMTELSDVMKGLAYGDKVQIITIAGKQGYMSKHAVEKSWAKELYDESLLTEEERNG